MVVVVPEIDGARDDEDDGDVGSSRRRRDETRPAETRTATESAVPMSTAMSTTSCSLQMLPLIITRSRTWSARSMLLLVDAIPSL